MSDVTGCDCAGRCVCGCLAVFHGGRKNEGACKGRHGTCGCWGFETPPLHVHAQQVLMRDAQQVLMSSPVAFAGFVDTMRAKVRDELRAKGLLAAWWPTWWVEQPSGLFDMPTLRAHVPACRARLAPRPLPAFP